MENSIDNLGFKNEIEMMDNETLKNFFKEIVINNNKDLESFLVDICNKIELNSVIDGTEVFIHSIYFENKISFDIFLERGISINRSMIIDDKNYYYKIIPILIALDTNNTYFINKLLDNEEIKLFNNCVRKINGCCSTMNIITYLCEFTNDIGIFNNVLNKMILKSNFMF